MTFKRLLYLATLVAGDVALGLWLGSGITSILIAGMLTLFTVFMFWRTDIRIDLGEEALLAIDFVFGLVAMVNVWSWVLALVLFVFFGTIALTEMTRD